MHGVDTRVTDGLQLCSLFADWKQHSRQGRMHFAVDCVLHVSNYSGSGCMNFRVRVL